MLWAQRLMTRNPKTKRNHPKIKGKGEEIPAENILKYVIPMNWPILSTTKPSYQDYLNSGRLRIVRSQRVPSQF